MRKLTSLITLAVYLSTAVARPTQAESYPYRTKHVTVRLACAGKVDCERAHRVFAAAALYVRRAVNVQLDLTADTVDSETIVGPVTYRLFRWMLKPWAMREEMTLVFLPPMPLSDSGISMEEEGVIGLASAIGGLDKPCLAYIKLYGGDSTATRVAIHEIGHILGATHGPTGIMQPTVEASQYSDAYSAETIEQIEAYILSLS